MAIGSDKEAIPSDVFADGVYKESGSLYLCVRL